MSHHLHTIHAESTIHHNFHCVGLVLASKRLNPPVHGTKTSCLENAGSSSVNQTRQGKHCSKCCCKELNPGEATSGWSPDDAGRCGECACRTLNPASTAGSAIFGWCPEKRQKPVRQGGTILGWCSRWCSVFLVVCWLCLGCLLVVLVVVFVIMFMGALSLSMLA